MSNASGLELAAPSPLAFPALTLGSHRTDGIQFLKASGYTPIVTASEKNFDKLKQLGAAACYSYSDPDVASKIAKDYPKLRYALDTISEGKTTVTAVKAISQAAGKGKVITLLTNKDEELKQFADSVPAEPTLLCASRSRSSFLLLPSSSFLALKTSNSGACRHGPRRRVRVARRQVSRLARGQGRHGGLDAPPSGPVQVGHDQAQPDPSLRRRPRQHHRGTRLRQVGQGALASG